MSCNEFVLGQFECPEACPIWVPNPVWRCVGACIKTTDSCHVYNPFLHYIDTELNRCLPCAIPGCISCEPDGNSLFNPLNWLTHLSKPNTSRLNDLNSAISKSVKCYQCAKGFLLSENGLKCVFQPHLLLGKTRIFYKFIFLLAILFSIGFLLRIFSPNFELYYSTVSFIKKYKLRKNNKYYPFDSKLSRDNIAGIGILNYFKRVQSSAVVILILTLSSFTIDLVPYSNLLRSNNVVITFDSSGKPLFKGESLYETKERCSLLLSSNTNQFDSFNDEYYSNSFMKSYFYTSFTRYILILFLSVIFAFPSKERSDHKKPTLLYVYDIPTALDTETAIEDYYERLTGIRPTCNICYDYNGKYSKVVELALELNDYLDNCNATKLDHDPYLFSCGTIINKKISMARLLQGFTGMSLEDHELISTVRPTGQAFLQFETTNSHVEELSGRYRKFKSLSDIDWDSFSSKNVKLTPSSFVACCVGVICTWLLLFYVPYALYSLSHLNLWQSKLDLLTSTISISIFVTIGQIFVTSSICHLSRYLDYTSLSKKESFNLLTLYIFQMVNLLLNGVIIHLNLYGGQMKLFSLFDIHRNKNVITKSMLVAEEVSLSNSIYKSIIPSLIIIPNILDPLSTYILPYVFNAMHVIMSDMNLSDAIRLLKPPKFHLIKAYSTLLVIVTTSFILQFIIHDRFDASISLIALFILFLYLFYMNKYLILRHVRRENLNNTNVDKMALKIWAFATGILATCPAYWRWRMGGSIWLIPLSFAIHIGLINMFVFYVKPIVRRGNPEDSGVDLEMSRGHGLSSNPMHVIKSFAKVNSEELTPGNSGLIESQLIELSNMNIPSKIYYYETN